LLRNKPEVAVGVDEIKRLAEQWVERLAACAEEAVGIAASKHNPIQISVNNNPQKT
jgi:hypothetical protein